METNILTGLETKLLQMSKAITDYKDGRFRNMSTSDEEGHAELKEAFPEYEGLALEYNNKVHDLFDNEYFDNEYPKPVPLPPFIVFPTYSPTTIGWRMGAGEYYAKTWHEIIKSLSETEKKEYCGKYDYPAWWMDPVHCDEFTHCRYYHLPWKNKPRQK